MLRLTLYKSCKITNSYNTVFAYQSLAQSGQSTLEKYLELLTKKVFDIDDVYQEDKGQFIFELTTNDYNSIYQFNYMKIETLDSGIVNNKFIRFAFIDNIVIKNEVAVVSYSLDYYHSFIRSIKGMNPSFLSGLRVFDNSNHFLKPTYKLLPVDYAGNNELNIHSLVNVSTGVPHTENDYVSLIIEFQVYDGETYGESTTSYVQYGLVSQEFAVNPTDSWKQDTSITPEFIKFSNVNRVIEQLVRLQAGKLFIDMRLYNTAHTTQQVQDKQRYFKIGHIYVLPEKNIIKSLYTASDNTTKAIIAEMNSSGTRILAYDVNFVNSANVRKLVGFQYETLPYHSFKTRGIGYFSKIIPVSYNGTSIPITAYVYADENAFRTYLSVENKIIETTDCFEYVIPQTQLNGEVLAQQRISLQLQNEQLNTKEHLLDVKTQTSIWNTENNLEKSFNSALFGILGAMGGSMSGGSQASDFMPNVKTAINNLQYDIESARYNRKLISAKRDAINEPVYNSTTFISANNTALLNAKYDLCEFYITADNGMFVTDYINNSGYSVFEIIYDLTTLGYDSLDYTTYTGANYNVIQFNKIDLYGDFPSSVAQILNGIFRNGIKIWYDEYMREDNYI